MNDDLMDLREVKPPRLGAGLAAGLTYGHAGYCK